MRFLLIRFLLTIPNTLLKSDLLSTSLTTQDRYKISLISDIFAIFPMVLCQWSNGYLQRNKKEETEEHKTGRAKAILL